MYLKSILLRDWKAYAPEVQFDLPAPGKRKNVVIIGAKNGFGKTSLLEAIIFGLYGRDAMPLVARAEQGGDETRLKLNYSDFLEKALHGRALAETRTSMSVRLDFVGNAHDGELEYISIERCWHFSSGGKHLPDRDEVIVRAGPHQVLQRPGKQDDPEDFFRNFIARHTVPSFLAQFFLFDGERVQNLARRDMKSQVKIGIEGMLGASVLRELGLDLRDYSKGKQKEAGGSSASQTVRELTAEVGKLEAELAADELQQRDVMSELTMLRTRRDELMQQLRGGTGGAVSSVRALEEQRAKSQLEVTQHKDALASLLVNEFSLALAGKPLRDALARQLNDEVQLTKWKASLTTASGKVDQFLTTLESVAPPFEPPLSPAQLAALRAKVDAAWNTLWQRPPVEYAGSERHAYLTDTDKALVLARVDEVERLGQDAVEDLIHDLNKAEQALRQVGQRIAEFAGIEDTLQKVTTEFTEVAERVGVLEKQADELKRSIDGKRAQLSDKRKTLAKEQKAVEEGRPLLAKSELAEKIARMLGTFVDEAVQLQVQGIAEKMTEAYRDMAHKKVVERIAIEPDCNVLLLSKSGKDVRNFDPSAGENQIFAFALISAIAQAAEVRFPIVIDTPLARLDKDHRLNVLRHFTDRAGEQIILLSQNEEVVGDKLDSIRTKIAKTYLVETEQLSMDVGRSSAYESQYFEPIY